MSFSRSQPLTAAVVWRRGSIASIPFFIFSSDAPCSTCSSVQIHSTKHFISTKSFGSYALTRIIYLPALNVAST
eukprot:CCRYP_020671-RA/>CCRYP_020671-RA protein AED:0.17 eAED:0.17 QI:2/1/0.5/1/0/0/2/0/73